MSRTKKLGAGGLLLLGAGVLWWCLKPDSKAATAWPISQVAVSVLEWESAPRQLQATGELQAVNWVDLSSEASGKVQALHFESGQHVKKGQLLVQLNVQQELAEQKELQAKLDYQNRVLRRSHALWQEKAATREQWEQAQAERDMALGQLQAVQARIGHKRINAPFDGVVGIQRIQQGAWVQAGDVLASLVDNRRLWLNFAVDERYLPLLQVGREVQLQVDAHGDRVFTATLNAIEPKVSASRTVWVQALLDNADGALQAGMSSKLNFALGAGERVLTAPETAVLFSSYGETVYVLEQDDQHAWVARRRAVHSGERWDGKVELRGALQPGEQVVVSGQHRLSDGMPVQIQTEPAAMAVHKE